MFKSEEVKRKEEFEKIYDNHVDQIFRFVYLKVSSKETAEDITSKVFIRAWGAVKKGEVFCERKKGFQKKASLSVPESSASLRNPRAFLYQIARNLVIDYYRQNRKREDDEKGSSKNFPQTKVSLEKVVVPDKEMRADERAILESQVEEVKNALKGMKEEYQNVIIWYYLDELTSAEIADLLEKPESSIRVLIHRAVSALRKNLKTKK